jgi:hypothetical protein
MRRCVRALALVVCLVLLAASVAAAQPPGRPPGAPGQMPPPPPPPPALRDIPGRVKVFIDCSGFWDCDSAYFRENLTFVDHVRDREVADVHILITGQSTGSGGEEATLAFIGRGAFERANDELRYVAPPNSTSDAIRQGLVKKIKLGLMRYVSHSETADGVQIALAASAPKAPQQPTHDPWNYWVMSVRFSGSVSGESATTYQSFSGGASANRVTDAWKVSLSSSAGYSESSYDLGDGDWYVSISRSSSFSALVVKSLNAHWSAGLRASMGSSTYSNKDLYISAAPALEYNVFPYSESTRRSLTVQYSVGVSSFDYHEETLYGKASETLPNHSANVDVEAKQPWGQISASVDFSQYLSQLDKYRVESWGALSFRMKKGLSLNVSGGGSLIRDQLSLPKGEATTEEILVRQRQLKTSYDYSFRVGVSYTFGSIYNNIVNPRFGSGGGGMVIYY